MKEGRKIYEKKEDFISTQHICVKVQYLCFWSKKYQERAFSCNIPLKRPKTKTAAKNIKQSLL